MDLPSAFYRELVYFPVAAYTAGPVRRLCNELDLSQWQDPTERRRVQAEQLGVLLHDCRSSVPFYRALPEQANGGAADSVLRHLPFLNKSDLQRSTADLRSRERLGRLVPKTTGGSTGEPVTIWKTRDAWARELAATWRGYEWAGARPGDLQARFWGVAHTSSARWRAMLIDAVCHRVRIPAFAFTDADLERYVQLLNSRKPRWLYGYVSMLTEFARFVERRGIRLQKRPICVVTTSEVLTSTDRALLRDVFEAPVFNEYGCGELGTIAHECGHGSLHISEENMIVEVVQGEFPCDPGQPGELVITELNNRAFPLIRYRTGDFGVISVAPCDCGRTLRCLSEIQGRAYDFIRNRHGQRFHGEFLMYVFEDLRRQGADIRQFQVTQSDIDRFHVQIVPGPSYDPACEKTICARLRTSVDPDAIVEISHVESIARERSGKMRLIKGLPD